jgi:phosphoribosylanthranilate isomerase
MQAIAVTGPGAVAVAKSYASVADFLILDSVSQDIDGVGAAGVVHDWNVSAAIVEAVDVPVILAGGLSPANVADAVAIVRPWGVDSLTHTNAVFDDGSFRKDPGLVKDFVSGTLGGETCS